MPKWTCVASPVFSCACSNWGIALAVAGTWVGFAGRWWWFFDLFIHFRLQYSLVCVAALGWLCLRKRRVLAAFTALSLGMNLWPVAKTTWVQASKAQLDATWGLKVVSFNALFNNPRTIDVVDICRQART